MSAPDPTIIRRLLIANRGEIAIRVMRTCRDRGIETVAVYSDADRTAAHVLYADFAIAIGPAPASESYLVIDKIIDACKKSGADAIHPGYGFLSENAALVEACEREGIVFVGPPADAMRVMGSKTRARDVMEAAGVPTVPGESNGGRGFPTAAEARAAADEIGFPVLIKASAGGGGKGMRFVSDPDEFESAFDAARREAAAAFGDDMVYVEKAIVNARHVEIQVFADAHGNVVHLGERDCSIQRRHQKVIEEAPCPVLGSEIREAMGAAAVAAAKTCDYRGAGTVEFLYDGNGFYFLEMNTRLQVEHPVTEAIYDVDLVSWQLDVAEGRPLTLDQQAIDGRRRGAAIECRVYAEDPEQFLPSSGTVTCLRVPGGPYVRDDSSIYEGAVVSPHYDPLLSKLVVWGETRELALARLRRALSEYLVSGLRTNLRLHRRILAEADFCAGEYDTGYIEAHREELCRADTPKERATVLTAVAVERGRQNSVALPPTAELMAGPRPWRRAVGHWGN